MRTKEDYNNNSTPLVSISCITYQHAPYIRQCLDGFMMQKTDFAFEVLVHDDASTDGTADIIKEYEAKYPGIIKPLYQTENQWVKGRRGSARFNFPRAKGKYIAMCEGDDCWTDPLKLQKQVAFLEGNEEYSMCFHNALVDYEDKSRNRLFNKIRKSKEVSLKMIIAEWIIPTASIMFRASIINIPEWGDKIYSGDMILALMAIKEGKVFFIEDNMSIYRKRYNNDSVSAMMMNRERYIKLQFVKILEYYNIETDFVYFKELHSEINYRLLSLKIKEKNKKRKAIFIFFDCFRYIVWRALKKIHRFISYL